MKSFFWSLFLITLAVILLARQGVDISPVVVALLGLIAGIFGIYVFFKNMRDAKEFLVKKDQSSGE